MDIKKNKIMSENQDIQDDQLHTSGEMNEGTEKETVENVTIAPSTEELLAEEKDRYIRLFAEFEKL